MARFADRAATERGVCLSAPAGEMDWNADRGIDLNRFKNDEGRVGLFVGELQRAWKINELDC